MTSSTRSGGLRRRTPATMLGGLLSALLVLSGCSGSVYDVPLPGGADTGENPMKITVMFRDVLDLVPQTTVKVDDVTVGKVKSIKLKGYIAQVSIDVLKEVDLPDNARAEIRQTSLLGEKFVALSPPQDPGSGKLSTGDVIGLDRTGRNPEVEEVLGALSLLLNGGGVGQLKTIFSELNNAFEGRESEVRSVLTQIRSFVGQLDQNKESIVAVIENTNRLAVQLRDQDSTLKSALDNVPATLRSVNRQRDDLVKLLEALNRLSGVGVRVIQASKESTINSLRHLGPVLEGFGKAGESFPKSFEVFLTYPFVDAAIGRDPQVARNLHMGDYTNLSVNLDVKLADLPQNPEGQACDELAAIRKAVRDGAKRAAREIVAPLRQAGVPDPVADEIEKDLEARIVDRFLAQAERQCRKPSYQDMLAFGEGELADVRRDLPQRLKDLLAAVPGAGAAIDDVTSGITASVPSLPRAQLNSRYQDPQPIDPFSLAAYGLDPGIGTMLLQGVAEVR